MTCSESGGAGMEKADLALLVRRTQSDPTFRQLLLADPDAAVRAAGWDLPPEDLDALRAWHANLQDVTKLEELQRSLEHLLAERTSRWCD